MKTKLFIFAMFGLIALVSAGRLMADSMDKIVAVVNSDVITEEELSIFMKVSHMESDENLKGSPEELRQKYLDRLVEDKLLYQEAVRMGLKANDVAIEDRIKEMKMRAGSDNTFEQALKMQGLSLNDLRQKLREQFLVYQIIEQRVKQKVQVSPKEIADYFDAHHDDYLLPETAVVDSIFVADKEHVGEVQAALAKEDHFEDVAKEFSKKSNIDVVRRGQFKKELEDFVFGLIPGKPSDPFAVEGGFYIFLLKEIKPPSQQSLSDVKDTIRDQLEAEKTHTAMREFIESLKDKAYISLREA